MTRDRPTVVLVAARAGVSVASVSRVVDGFPHPREHRRPLLRPGVVATAL
ncbi:MAG: hypothetical protein AVDCRST_MAG34-3175 [uncultured Nocardioidaceae bacterium]|uniref:Uncharacterized protein n=1 Tax=uncultured Nocardioidaceae bacterium TaxID=253824 RepID=A0A6J4MYP6_9ACTN|nr:MAG: hypothetical protein AVDCRST_MAG34-3175 [uncultured Nocardioidaceae bacterium]